MADPVLESPKNPHFFQPLLSGFHSYLKIPVKFFSVHIEGRKEKNMVKLRSEACKRTWKVKLEGRKLTDGWKHFAGAHDFRIGDIILFRHEGDLVFHVTGFGPSCCEIQYLQSCNKKNDDEEEKENMRNLSMDQNLKTEYFVAHVTDSNLRDDRLFFPQRFSTSNGLKRGSKRIVLVNEEARRWTLNLKCRKSSLAFYMSAGWRSFCHENGLQPGDSITFKLESNNTKTPILCFSRAESKSVSAKHSSKRKRSIGEGGQSVSSSSSLSEDRLVTLTATPASLQYYKLYLPVSFIRVNGMENAKKTTLLNEHGEMWTVNLQTERGKTRMRLGLGLREFFKANDIEAYDSFVLELFWEDATTPILKLCSKIKTLL